MTVKKPFKKQLFAYFAQVAKAISNPNRLEILEFLAQRECAVEDLASLTGLTIANTSHHLQQLRQMGLVTCRKEGQYVIYRLSGEDVIELLSQLRLVAERHLDNVNQLIDDYLKVKDDLEAVPADELVERARQGLVTVLDVRPESEFKAGHLPGALNIPLSELENKLNELDREKEIIAYCRGPHCVLAYDAVEKLRQKGLKARRLDGGYPEWKVMGLPVE
ncbi:MAG TPA: metalloregulator ArsR/SmtB family transcription factor [Gammaproteobacteria bacterium]|nr:metalloregulator ArsR/SmtB family transcription factor [Gammaproteobacteria bacterium]